MQYRVLFVAMSGLEAFGFTRKASSPAPPLTKKKEVVISPHVCNVCSKTFGNTGALASHRKFSNHMPHMPKFRGAAPSPEMLAVAEPDAPPPDVAPAATPAAEMATTTFLRRRGRH